MSAPSEVTAAVATTTWVEAAAGPLVLVADDEVPTQTLLRIVLNSSGFRTVEAHSGAEALERAAAYNPDLVLLDLGLPDSDGLDVTRGERDRVLTHRQLLEAVWGPRFARQTQYLRVYIGHLRKKLEQDPARPRYLLTEPGVGYQVRG